ncbi:MAG: type I DNA topoisomerase [Candidatus Bipolaricaulia bacterium]
MSGKRLVIVESPTKANTIGRYLGRGFKALSSKGHVRDLPKKELGVDIEHDFTPRLLLRNRKLIKELRDEAKGAEAIYLATDNDREGEAIAYDLYEVLKGRDGNLPFRRVIFNEITRDVILKAIGHPVEIDTNKVEAQRARRILDRLVGYQISPLLSKSVSGSKYAGLSAGRVQSVALRFICDRESEIQAFQPEEYWEIAARLAPDSGGSEFVAQLKAYRGERLSIETEKAARRIERAVANETFAVAHVEARDRTRTPPPPFITSTLQRAASSILRFSPKRTMRIAQQLYEGIELDRETVGLITYMRTDSTRVAERAQEELRSYITDRWGEDHLAPEPRIFRNKKTAQDAHEAIRATEVGRTPDRVQQYLTGDQYKLYKLIWERFVATQMAEARYRQRKLVIAAGDYTFQISGSIQIFAGFLKVLKLKPLRDEGVEIPELAVGDRLELREILLDQRFTEPPNRYSEASLIKALEQRGIGRPSTYATIVSTIQDRGYVHKERGLLHPTLLGFIVTDFLQRFFPEIVRTDFTADMEENLDRISDGGFSRTQLLQAFYVPFEKQLHQVQRNIEDGGAFQVLTDVPCPACGSPMEIRYWKGNRFLGCSRYPECQEKKEFPLDVGFEYHAGEVMVRERLEQYAERLESTAARCPKCGAAMEVRHGRYGRYQACTNQSCGHTQPLPTGVSCPSCGDGELVERFSRKTGKPFYGCNRYPDCTFAVNRRPTGICPECQAGVLMAFKDELRCSQRNCGHRIPIPTAEEDSK